MTSWEVKPGAIRVAHVFRVHDQADVRIFELDLHSKYPGATSWQAWNQRIEVFVASTERTLGVDENLKDQDTSIVFDLGEDEFGWRVLAEAVRYTVRICMYRYPTREGRQ